MAVAIHAALLALLIAAAPAAAEWRRAESPNFIVYSSGSEGRLRERILQLEEFHRLLTALISSAEAETTASKLTVYLLSGHDEMRRVANMSRAVGGFYSATPFGIAAFINAEIPLGNEILFHEYAHHFMMQYGPRRAYPAWYVEGFAEYLQTAEFRPRETAVGLISDSRLNVLINPYWLPMDRVLFGNLQGLTLNQTHQFYGLSWLLVHYFHSDPARQAQLRRYLTAIREGADPRAAFERETGFTITALTAALRGYVGDRGVPYARLTRPASTPPAVAITALPRSADDLLLYEASLRVRPPADGTDERLERVRAAAARHGEDPYAMRARAHAEVLLGDRAAAGQLLDSLLAASPNDAELLYLKGLRYLFEAEDAAENSAERAGHAREAARWFTRAHRANPNHYQSLYRYTQSLRGRPDYASDNTAEVLVLAHQLAPQVIEISMQAAAVLISRGDVDLAESILQPLASHPHSETLAQEARQLLERARAERAPSTPQPRQDPAAPGTAR